jgi:pimeloyl-ACP methyl ester carboxylesterase
MKRTLLTILFLIVAGYLGICALLYFKQDRLLFFPSREAAADLEALAKQAGFEPWTNARGERIGWKSIDGDPTNALLICHGNGGFALGRNYTNMRQSAAGGIRFQIFLLEYPGYGARPGIVSTKSLTEAAVEAIDTLAVDPSSAGDRSPRRIWLMGQSLGSGIASAAVAARPDKISGLILLTPFDSLSAAAGTHYPWLPVRLLLRHRLDSDRNLEKYHGPVAFIVAGNDGTIPPRHGEHLYEEYAGPKRLWLVPGAGHNDFEALLADWPQIVAWLTSPPAGN